MLRVLAFPPFGTSGASLLIMLDWGNAHDNCAAGSMGTRFIADRWLNDNSTT